MCAMANSSVDLYFVRHADAGDPAKWSGPDELRPLSAKGRAQAERLGRHLAANHVSVGAIISSPKLRAKETAELIAAEIGGQVTIDDRLGGGLTADILDTILTDAGNPAKVIVAGHDPDFSELVAELSGAGSIPMRKGALARLEASRPLQPGAATLRWLLPPDALGRDRG
jgi:phosphohistidine phosphatase